MTSTELIGPPQAPEHLAYDEGPDEVVPLIGVVAVAGPPVILVAGPLVLFALLIAGPALLLLTFVVVLAVCGVLVALAGAIVASPYLLVRHLAGHGLPSAPRRLPAAQLVPLGSRRGPA